MRKPRMDEPQGPHFVNVDLEVWSKTKLSVLGEAVEPIAFVLYSGKIRRKFLLSFEAALPKVTSPESAIWALLKVVEALPPRARKAWKAAQSRVFNVGFRSGDFITLLRERPVGSGRWYAANPKKAAVPCETSLSTKVLQAVAKVDGTIATTIYPPTREVPSRRRKAKPSTTRRRPT